MTSEVSILIWLPAGEVPQAPVFEGAGATTCGSLAEALNAAHTTDDWQTKQPWISTSGTIFSPEQIRLLASTFIDADGQ